MSFFLGVSVTREGHHFEALPRKKISKGTTGLILWENTANGTENVFNVRYSQCAFFVDEHIELMVLSCV